MERMWPGTRALRTFDAAARHLNFSRAADEVGLTGAVDTHNNTATGNKEWTTSVKG